MRTVKSTLIRTGFGSQLDAIGAKQTWKVHNVGLNLRLTTSGCVTLAKSLLHLSLRSLIYNVGMTLLMLNLLDQQNQ